MNPRVVNTPVGGDASVEFNGLRQNHNIYLLDGGEDDDRGGAGGMSIAPSSDAIAEFRATDVELQRRLRLVFRRHDDDGSQVGLEHAACVGVGIQSQRCARCAQPFNPAPQPVAELRLNVFGFNVGGPVTLGKFYNRDRKKTFFFYNMEWRRLIQGSITQQPDGSRSGDVRRQLQQRCNADSTFRQRRQVSAPACWRRTAPAA